MKKAIVIFFFHNSEFFFSQFQVYILQYRLFFFQLRIKNIWIVRLKKCLLINWLFIPWQKQSSIFIASQINKKNTMLVTYVVYMLSHTLRLFQLDLGPPKNLNELEPDSREYWKLLRKEHIWRHNKLHKGKKM